MTSAARSSQSDPHSSTRHRRCVGCSFKQTTSGMMMMVLRAAAALLLLVGQAWGASTVADDALTYGSVVKLEHSESQYYLHSHQINWGSGSGQQSVTCHGGADDQGSLWVVAEANGDKFHEAGEPVPCGAKVRLTHMETRKNLHSHLFQSPLSSQQEVSCFGDKGRGDTGDNWEVVCAAKGATHWRRGEEVRFKHLDTGKQLAAEKKWAFTQRNCPNCPIVGQLEVSCARAQSAPATGWKATMGMFFHPKQPDAVNDEL